MNSVTLEPEPHGRRSPLTDLASVLWGVAEGTLFFIVPDVLITSVAGFSPRRGLRSLLLVIVGSVLGGAALFQWSAGAPETARRIVEGTPFVRPSMINRVTKDFEEAGVWALCRGPTSGIPYKLFAVQAPAHVGLGPFLLVSVPARAERLLLTWAQSAVLGVVVRRYAARPRAWLCGLHGVYWSVAYTYYWFLV